MVKQKRNVQNPIQNIIINQIYFNTSLRRAYIQWDLQLVVQLISWGAAFSSIKHLMAAP